MQHTFSDVLKTFSDVLPDSLISPINFDKLLKTTERFPYFFSPGIAFETRLSDKIPALDMFLSIEAARKNVAAEMLINLGSDQNWQNIGHFCEKWSDIGSPVCEFVNRLFLEFDTSDESQNSMIPAVFFQIDEKAFNPSDSQPDKKKKNSVASDIQWIFDSLQTLNGRKTIAATREIIIMCYKHLLQGSYIDHVAVMPSRIPEVIRLNINNLSEESLFLYISSIGLESQISKLKPILTECWPFIDHVVLALDIDRTILPRIGIEFRLPKNSLNFESQYKWVPFLDYLEEQGLCTSRKKQGLIDWVGKSMDLAISDRYRFNLYRYIHFIKAVFQENEPVYFKGYFTAVIIPQ